MERLPPLEEQAYLLRELGSLIAAVGVAPFVSAPLLEPRAEHFPDPWRADALGVERLARRLLTYAGMADLGVDVELYASEREVTELDGRGNATAWSHQGAAAWFAGIVDGRCLFGAENGKLDTPDLLAGVMAHEVAHAFRRRRELEVSRREVEERLTDLTTVYLGFGILTTNGSYRYRASGELMGASTRTQWSHQQTGYLSPQSMSFLLAAQVIARGATAGEQRRIAGLLEPNQAACFRAACDALDRDTVLERLRLPPPAEWPAVVEPRPVAFDTSADPPPPDRAAQETAAIAARNDGFPIFRVAQAPSRVMTFAAVVAGIIVAAVFSSTLPTLGCVGIVVGAFLLGHGLDRPKGVDRCSEPDCATVIPADALRCPGCAGVVSGRIANRNERLAAREELEGGDAQQDDADDEPAA